MRTSSRRPKQTAALSAVVMSRYWRPSDAEQVMQGWRRSGLSGAAFAREHGISARRLLRWRRRLKGNETPLFHPVRLITSAAPDAPRAPSLELEVRGGRRIHVARGFDPELLEELVRTVEGFRC
jgi:transposase-like protein